MDRSATLYSAALPQRISMFRREEEVSRVYVK